MNPDIKLDRFFFTDLNSTREVRTDLVSELLIIGKNLRTKMEEDKNIYLI